jgi:hypothetical protein
VNVRVCMSGLRSLASCQTARGKAGNRIYNMERNRAASSGRECKLILIGRSKWHNHA